MLSAVHKPSPSPEHALSAGRSMLPPSPKRLRRERRIRGLPMDRRLLKGCKTYFLRNIKHPLPPHVPETRFYVPRIKYLSSHANKQQVWLAMYHLMCEEECRKRYHFNSMRKNNILRVRKYLNDVLLDQLPVLAAVQRQANRSSILRRCVFLAQL